MHAVLTAMAKGPEVRGIDMIQRSVTPSMFPQSNCYLPPNFSKNDTRSRRSLLFSISSLYWGIKEVGS
jgi:hypothetical protein